MSLNKTPDTSSETSQDSSQSNAQNTSEPVIEFESGGNHITVLGTAHVSKASAEMVTKLIESGEYQTVALELCPSRHHAIVNPDAMSKMDLFQVLKDGKAPMVMASLALGAYQQRMAEQLGIEPGAEMRAAINSAKQKKLEVELIDRDIGITLKRIYRNIPWWRRYSGIDILPVC